eukprot:770365_1
MEHEGIGTDASIPQHIANICEREYAQVDQKTRCMKPTQLGLLLGHGYYKIDPQLVLPELRAYMERNMTAVAKGQIRKDAVINSVLNIFAAKFDYFVKKFEKMDKMFDHLYNNPANLHGGKFLSRCGICKKKMKLFRARGPPKLYCEFCKQQYVLPKGEIKAVEYECPLSKFQLVKFSKANKSDDAIKITYPISPFEFMYSPSDIYDPERPKLGKRKRGKKKQQNINEAKEAEEYKFKTAIGELVDVEEINPDKLKKEMGCNRCWYSECEYSAKNNMVKPCPRCNAQGTTRFFFILDRTSGPQKWRICCNNPRCDNMIQISTHAPICEINKKGEDCEKCKAKKK